MPLTQPRCECVCVCTDRRTLGKLMEALPPIMRDWVACLIFSLFCLCLSVSIETTTTTTTTHFRKKMLWEQMGRKEKEQLIMAMNRNEMLWCSNSASACLCKQRLSLWCKLKLGVGHHCVTWCLVHVYLFKQGFSSFVKMEKSTRTKACQTNRRQKHHVNQGDKVHTGTQMTLYILTLQDKNLPLKCKHWKLRKHWKSSS